MKHIEEAHRYIDNAKENFCEKAHKEYRYYQDTKYEKRLVILPIPVF